MTTIPEKTHRKLIKFLFCPIFLHRNSFQNVSDRHGIQAENGGPTELRWQRVEFQAAEMSENCRAGVLERREFHRENKARSLWKEVKSNYLAEARL